LAYTSTHKIIIFGDSNSGKTTLVHRFLTNRFSEDISITLGVEFQIKIIEIDGEKVKLQIWDFAGETSLLSEEKRIYLILQKYRLKI